MFEFLGLSNAATWIEVWGLDGEDFANKTLLTLDGEPRGLLQLASGEPLKPENLAPIPRDATVAAAFRLDLEKALDVVLASYEKTDPKKKADVTHTIEEWERSLGVNLRHGTLKSMGDTWCVYGSPNEGNLFFTGLTAVVPLRDWAGMNLAYGRLMGAARQWLPKREERPDNSVRTNRIERFNFAGNDVYWLASDEGILGDMPFPFMPSWCMTKQEMVFAVSPQNVRAYLSHDSRHKPIQHVPQVADLFSKDGGPVMIAYGDSLFAFKLGYPVLNAGGRYLLGELQAQSPEAHMPLLPSALPITRHLGPTVATLRRTKDGIEFVSRGTIPLPSLPVVIAIGAYMASFNLILEPPVVGAAVPPPASAAAQPTEKEPATLAPAKASPPTTTPK